MLFKRLNGTFFNVLYRKVTLKIILIYFSFFQYLINNVLMGNTVFRAVRWSFHGRCCCLRFTQKGREGEEVGLGFHQRRYDVNESNGKLEHN